MKQYVILGVGSTLSCTFDIIHANGDRVAKIYQNVPEVKSKSGFDLEKRVQLAGYPIEVHNSMESFRYEKQYEYTLGFISPQKHRFITELKDKHGIPFNPLIHPTAYLGSNVTVGEGVCIMPRALIDCNVTLGDFCTLNKGAVVGHEACIGKYSLLGPIATIAGSTTIGECCFIGMQATVIEKLTIGDWSIIGAGSVVTKDIPPGIVAVGIPARQIKENKMRDFNHYRKMRFGDS